MSQPAIPRLVPHANEISLDAEARSPIDVLRTQTDYWGELTDGEVTAVVEDAVTTPGRIAYGFSFVVPAVHDYRYRLFLVEHGLEFYPAWIRLDRGEAHAVEVADEATLCVRLGEIFRSPDTLKALKSLRALALEARPTKRASGA